MAVEYVCIIRTESAMQMVHYVYQVYAYRLQVSDDPFYHRALHLDIACQECCDLHHPDMSRNCDPGTDHITRKHHTRFSITRSCTTQIFWLALVGIPSYPSLGIMHLRALRSTAHR